MVMSILLAVLALPLPAGELRLDCALTDDGNDGAPPTELTITLDVRGRGIDSAEIDGPPLFSSSQGLILFDATPTRRGGMNITQSQPSRRELRWTPRLEAGRIALQRRNSRITLEPDSAAEGAWRGTYDLGEIGIGHMRGDGPSGLIACRSAGAGSSAR